MAYRETKRFGLYVGKKRKTFFRTWLGLARCLSKYSDVEPGDFLEVAIRINRKAVGAGE